MLREKQLAKNFWQYEFECRGKGCCGGSAPMSPPLIMLLQDIREYIDVPVDVTSGFRCRTHNARTPNAHPDSYHTYGIAADITVRNMPVAQLMTAVQKAITEAGYGYAIPYPTRGIVHVDIRNYW